MKFFNLILLSLAVNVGLAQSSVEVQYGAYLKASKSLWERSVSLAAQESGAESFDRAFALYGLLNNTMVSQDEETFDQYVDDATELLEDLIEEAENSAEAKAVLSSVYGLKMAYSPMNGLFLGMKSTSLMEEALQQSPDSPLVQKLFANSKLYTPERWGGSIEQAIASFTLAVELYEKKQDTTHWVYLDALMGLSMAYTKDGNTTQAREVLLKIIDREPNHYWAKSALAKLDAK